MVERVAAATAMQAGQRAGAVAEAAAAPVAAGGEGAAKEGAAHQSSRSCTGTLSLDDGEGRGTFLHWNPPDAVSNNRVRCCKYLRALMAQSSRGKHTRNEDKSFDLCIRCSQRVVMAMVVEEMAKAVVAMVPAAVAKGKVAAAMGKVVVERVAVAVAMG